MSSKFYNDYLNSSHWKQRRSEIIARCTKTKQGDKRCHVCLKAPCFFNVHHLSYERLGEEQDKDLVALCRDCHALFHKYSKIIKVDPNDRYGNRRLLHGMRKSRDLTNNEERKTFIFEHYRIKTMEAEKHKDKAEKRKQFYIGRKAKTKSYSIKT